MMSIDTMGRLVRDTRGSVLMLVAAGMVFMLGMTGLAVDSGRGYLTRLRLVRAVDAAALTGARTLRSGETVAREQATAARLRQRSGDGDQRSHPGHQHRHR